MSSLEIQADYVYLFSRQVLEDATLDALGKRMAGNGAEGLLENISKERERLNHESEMVELFSNSYHNIGPKKTIQVPLANGPEILEKFGFLLCSEEMSNDTGLNPAAYWECPSEEELEGYNKYLESFGIDRFPANTQVRKVPEEYYSSSARKAKNDAN